MLILLGREEKRGKKKETKKKSFSSNFSPSKHLLL
jgi:hypothetical protein